MSESLRRPPPASFIPVCTPCPRSCLHPHEERRVPTRSLPVPVFSNLELHLTRDYQNTPNTNTYHKNTLFYLIFQNYFDFGRHFQVNNTRYCVKVSCYIFLLPKSMFLVNFFLLKWLRSLSIVRFHFASISSPTRPCVSFVPLSHHRQRWRFTTSCKQGRSLPVPVFSNLKLQLVRDYQNTPHANT